MINIKIEIAFVNLSFLLDLGILIGLLHSFLHSAVFFREYV
jgi:hypothetical protein